MICARIVVATVLILVGSLAAVSASRASSLTLAWTASTTRTDGTPVTGLKTAIHYGTTTGGPYGSEVDAGTATTLVVNGLTGGTRYCFVATAYLGPFATPTEESANSNEACGTAPISPISPPTLLRIPGSTASIAPTTFGVAPLATTTTKNVSVRNLRTDAPLTITGVSVTGPESSAYSVTPVKPLPMQIPAGKARALTASFTPRGPGYHEAVAIIQTDQGAMSYPMTGVGEWLQ